MQHRLEVDQCQGSQVSSLSKQLEKSVEKVEVWLSFRALLKERNSFAQCWLFLECGHQNKTIKLMIMHVKDFWDQPVHVSSDT